MGKERGKVNPERVRQRFSREFKLEAVRLLEQGGKPATQLAMELGIQRNRLYKWQKELGANGAKGVSFGLFSRAKLRGQVLY
jgi:transposase